MSSTGSFFQLVSTVVTLVMSYYFPGAAAWLMAANVASNMTIGAIDAREDRRRAKNAYNASLKDRMEMAEITPDFPRTLAMGRVRAVEGIRRRWVSGVNSEKLTMVVSLAGHQIDGVEQWYADDVALTLDGSGYVTTAPYRIGTPQPASVLGGTLNASGGAVVNLPVTPDAGSVVAVYWTVSVENGTSPELPLTVSVAGNQVTLSGGADSASYTLVYTHTAYSSRLRIRTYLGAPGQNVGAELAAEYPGDITATDRFEGIALAVIDLDYDPDVFPQGRPNFTAVFRGAPIYDPRLDSTVPGGSGAHRVNLPATWAFSENPALHAYHLARLATGWAVPAAEINTADVIAAASACDVPTNFTLRQPDNTTTVVSLPRYRCGIVVSSDKGLREAMDEIMECMAGRWGWAGGVLRMRAGTMAAPVFALTPDWIAQRVGERGEPGSDAVIRITNGVPRDRRVNRVSGKCVNPAERWQALPYPAIQDAVLIAADGATYARDVDYEGVNHPAHAQHLGSVAIRESQASLSMQAQCNFSAYRCELFDVGTIDLPRFGMAGTTFEVLGWRWHPQQGVQLSLAEITAAIYTPLAEMTGQDPAPNSSLRPPWSVDSISGVAVTSGTEALSDGSILTRTSVAWSAVVQQSVRVGGSVEVQYTEASAALPTGEWPSWVEQGSATSATIPGLRTGKAYMFRARAVQAVPPVRGAWSASVMHVVASVRAPRIFRQSAAPTGDVGDDDQWFDADDGNRQYVRLAGAWVDVRDAGIAAAQTTANNASTAASTAQNSADTANAALASIASDGVLTAGEKPPVVRDHAVITSEQAGIDAQATAYGVTTEKTAYDAAVSALTAYLGTLTGWNVIPGSDVVIVGATFRQKFADVYTTRQVLLTKIAEIAGTRAAWATVTGAGRPADNATKNNVTFAVLSPSSPTDGDIWLEANSALTAVINVWNRVGGAWKSANTTVTSSLSATAAVLPADSAGTVTSYAAGVTTATVMMGNTVDTANWAISATNGPGVTSSVAGATVSVTGLVPDVGYLDVVATRSGFPQQTLRFALTKNKAPASGLVSGISLHSQAFKISPADALTGVRLHSDGTCSEKDSTGAYQPAGNWYLPTTAGIGASYWVRVTMDAGSDVFTAGDGTGWVQLSVNREWRSDVTNIGINDCAATYVLSLTSGGATVASGAMSCLAEVEP